MKLVEQFGSDELIEQIALIEVQVEEEESPEKPKSEKEANKNSLDNYL
jgi:hypothetical protein